jgi:hypothetical protein
MAGKRFLMLTVSIAVGIFIAGVFLGVVQQAQASITQDLAYSISVSEQPVTATQQTLYLPMAMKYYHPLYTVFGVEPAYNLLQNNNVFNYTKNLPARWVRLNDRISWRDLQLTEGAPIQWELLVNFEQELRALREADITPIVIVDDYPRWATDNTARDDGQPTSCGRLLEDKVDDFALFVTELVNRYKTSEFGVHNWELGNEPDTDPNYVIPDNEFGCWGDTRDAYYGGEAYGRMIIQVGGAVKAADTLARVWIGGLLLGAPNSTDPNAGHQELFFEGVLRSGAAPYFDVVPYHWYPSYGKEMVFDADLNAPAWASWGGGTVGKARFLRQVMEAYGVSKQVVLDETAFGCPYDWTYVYWCYPPSDAFFDLQASFVARTATRAYNENISGFIWYHIDYPAFRWWELLDATQSPKPVYWAYSQVINQLNNSRSLGSVTYAPGIEAYAFDRGSDRLDVLWSIDNQTITITVPISNWVAAYGRNGEVLTPVVDGSNYLIPVGFSPVYLIKRP